MTHVYMYRLIHRGLLVNLIISKLDIIFIVILQ